MVKQLSLNRFSFWFILALIVGSIWHFWRVFESECCALSAMYGSTDQVYSYNKVGIICLEKGRRV